MCAVEKRCQRGGDRGFEMNLMRVRVNGCEISLLGVRGCGDKMILYTMRWWVAFYGFRMRKVY